MKLTKIFVFLFASMLTASALYASEKGGRVGKIIAFKASDGFNLTGLFVPPAGKGSKFFVMLHGLGSNQEEWQSLIKKFVKNGTGFFTYDMRGHGESILDGNNKKRSYDSFPMEGSGTEWDKMVGDLNSALDMLVTQKGIDKSKVVLLGASLGANLCLSYASRDPGIRKIVLLSPGMNYAGITTLDKADVFSGREVLVAAARNDTNAYQSSRILVDKLLKFTAKAVFIEGEGGRHGVQMFDGKFENQMLRWIY